MIYLWAIVHTRTWCCCCCCSISHLPHSYTCTKMINWWERKLNFMSIWFWIKDAFLLHVLYVIFAAAVSRNYGLIIKFFQCVTNSIFLLKLVWISRANCAVLCWYLDEFWEMLAMKLLVNDVNAVNLVTLCHQSSCILMLEYSKNNSFWNLTFFEIIYIKMYITASFVIYRQEWC